MRGGSRPTSTDRFSQPIDIEDQKQNILDHFRENYQKMERIILTRALDRLTETDICDLVNDQNSMHNFGLGVGQVTRLN